MAWLEFFIIFIGIMLVSSIGFKSYVWFISLGYGLGISVTGILLLLMYHSMMDIYQIIACVIFILYGFRLSGYLAYREFVGKTYLKNMKGEIKSGKGMPFFTKCMLWVTCALLYFTMCSPIAFRIANNSVSDTTFMYNGSWYFT